MLSWGIGGTYTYSRSKLGLGKLGERSEALRHLLHRTAKKFLRPGGSGLRHDIEKIAEGTPLQSLCLRTRRNVATLRFVCLSERVVEAGHKDIKAPAGYRRCGPVSASLYVRMATVLERALCLDEHGLDDTIAALSETRCSAVE